MKGLEKEGRSLLCKLLAVTHNFTQKLPLSKKKEIDLDILIEITTFCSGQKE